MANILFIQDLSFEVMGVMYLSAMLKTHHHSTKLIIANEFDQAKKTIESYRPDLVGFSITTGSHRWAAQMARQIKKTFGIRSIFGGPHPTYFPDYIHEEGVEIMVRGEGEFPLLEVMDRLEEKKDFADVPNVTTKRDGKIQQNPLRKIVDNIDLYPFPDRSLYNFMDKRIDRTIKSVLLVRGCPYRCTFCFAAVQRGIYPHDGNYLRFRSIDNAIQEIKQLKQASRLNQVFFLDSVLGLNKKWLYEFLEVYKKEIGIDFFCNIRANLVDEEYVKKLKEAGCLKVFFGIEAGNEKLRNELLQKQINNEHIYRTAELLHKYGIKFRAYNILGLPEETLETAYETVQINIDIKTDFPWCSLFSPIPGTQLTQYAYDHGFLDKDFNFDQLPQSYYSYSVLKLADKTKIENLQKFFQIAVLWPWTFPLIKKLIKLRPNIIYNLLFSLVYFYVYYRAETVQFWKTLLFAIYNYKNIIFKKPVDESA